MAAMAGCLRQANADQGEETLDLAEVVGVIYPCSRFQASTTQRIAP